MNKSVIVVAIILTVLLQANSLTLREAKHIALKNNPELKASYYSMKSSEWSVFENMLEMFPKLSLTGTYTEYHPEIEIIPPTIYQEYSESASLTLTQPVFNGGKIFQGYQIVKAGSRISQASYRDQLLKTGADVESKYFSVLESFKLLKIAEKDLTLARANLETAEIKYRLGTISKADYLNMQSQAASREVTLIQRKNQYELARLSLAKYLQISSDYEITDIPLEDYRAEIDSIRKLESPAINRIIKEFLAFADRNNPGLEIARLNKEISFRGVKLARGSFYPSINLSITQSWDKKNYEDEYSDQGLAMLTLSIPIFQIATNYTELKQSKYNLKESEQNLISTHDSIFLSVEQSVYNYITSAKSVHASEIAFEFAKETYAQMEVRYQNNMISSQDLLDAELLYISTQNQYTTSFYNYLRARSALIRVLGLENEKEFIELINK